jgi:hypothetical protein
LSLNIVSMLQDYIVYLAGGATFWLFAKTWKNSRDMNALFKKIRRIESELNIETEKDLFFESKRY